MIHILSVLCFVCGTNTLAQAQTPPPRLPSPQQWRTLGGMLAELSQEAFARDVQNGKAQAKRCVWTSKHLQCSQVSWTYKSYQLKLDRITWRQSTHIEGVHVTGNQRIKTITVAGTQLTLSHVQWPMKHQLLLVDNATLPLPSGTITLNTIRWRQGKTTIASTRRARSQERAWMLNHFTLTDAIIEQRIEAINTTKANRARAGWLSPQLTSSQGAGFDIHALYAFEHLGVGAHINLGRYYTGTLALFGHAPFQQPSTLHVNVGLTHDGDLAHGAIGQYTLGSSTRHLDISAQHTSRADMWQTQRMQTNQFLSPWQRTRLGLSASQSWATLQLSAFEDAHEYNAEAEQRGAALVFGTQRPLNRWLTAQVNLAHHTIAQSEVPTLNQSRLHAGLDLNVGSTQRLYARAHVAGWMFFQVEEALQGWSASTAARLTAQGEVGAGLRGRGQGWVHDITPRVVVMEQPVINVKGDNRIATPLPSALRQTWGVYSGQLNQSLVLGQTHQLLLPLSVSWMRATDLGGAYFSAAARYKHLTTNTSIGLRTLNHQRSTFWQVACASPTLLNTQIQYMVGNLTPRATAYATSIDSESLPAQLLFAESRFEDTIEDELKLRHQGLIHWQSIERQKSARVGAVYADSDTWSTFVAMTIHQPRLGWSVGALGAVEQKEAQTTYRFGLGITTKH